MLLETQRRQGTPLPFAHIRFQQTRFGLDLEPARLRNGDCRLKGAFQGTRINGFDGHFFERLCQRLGLTLSALVQMNIWQVASQFVLPGEIVFAVADQE